LFPLNATTLALSLAGHLIYGTTLDYGLWAWQVRAGRDLSRAAETSSAASPPDETWVKCNGTVPLLQLLDQAMGAVNSLDPAPTPRRR
jgi:hypothetical protein